MGRCDELSIDHWPGHHPPPPAADDDAGVEEETCGPQGLYADRFCKHLERGVIPYTPRFELWSDGADKQRFIYLPEGEQIDTSNPDRWNFPRGTRLYKTFSLNGKRLETRVFEKNLGETAGIASWSYVSWAWDEDQRSVVAVPEGRENVLGTQHNIPKQSDCVSCHDQTRRRPEPTDIVNGFEAIQLNHDGSGWTLERLLERDRLVNLGGEAPNVTLVNAGVPGRRAEQAALGYLHSNCGNCHVGETPAASLDLSLRIDTTQLPATARAYQAACQSLMRWTGRENALHEPYVLAVDPGSAATSGIIGRMIAVGQNEQMPSIGREQSDDVGIETVSRWIDDLDQHCDLPSSPTP
jgi:hypothetical protein